MFHKVQFNGCRMVWASFSVLHQHEFIARAVDPSHVRKNASPKTSQDCFIGFIKRRSIARCIWWYNLGTHTCSTLKDASSCSRVTIGWDLLAHKRQEDTQRLVKIFIVKLFQLHLPGMGRRRQTMKASEWCSHFVAFVGLVNWGNLCVSHVLAFSRHVKCCRCLFSFCYFQVCCMRATVWSMIRPQRCGSSSPIPVSLRTSSTLTVHFLVVPRGAVRGYLVIPVVYSDVSHSGITFNASYIGCPLQMVLLFAFVKLTGRSLAYNAPIVVRSFHLEEGSRISSLCTSWLLGITIVALFSRDWYLWNRDSERTAEPYFAALPKPAHSVTCSSVIERRTACTCFARPISPRHVVRARGSSFSRSILGQPQHVVHYTSPRPLGWASVEVRIQVVTVSYSSGKNPFGCGIIPSRL